MGAVTPGKSTNPRSGSTGSRRLVIAFSAIIVLPASSGGSSFLRTPPPQLAAIVPVESPSIKRNVSKLGRVPASLAG